MLESNNLMEHIEAINTLYDRIRLSGYSSKGKMLALDPNWLELKEHLSEMLRGV